MATKSKITEWTGRVLVTMETAHVPIDHALTIVRENEQMNDADAGRVFDAAMAARKFILAM